MVALTNVLDGDGGVGGRGAGQDLAVLLNVYDSSAGGSDRTSAGGGLGAGEGDLAEVGEVHEGAAGLEVLDDPLGVELLQSVGLAGEGVGDGLSRGDVLDDSLASGLAGGGDGHGDGVTGRDGDAAEVVTVKQKWSILTCRNVCSGR